MSTFEERFADHCKVSYCRAVNSGTWALYLALLAAGVGEGDEVITVSMAPGSAAAAILRTGAIPVFVDVDPLTWTINPCLIEAAITSRTKAIVPVHLYGQMADMDPIMSIGRRNSLVVVEDAGQAPGAEYKGFCAGSVGDLGCFSFYPERSLGAYGEAGAVVTRDPELARRISGILEMWRLQAGTPRLGGYCDSMDVVQAAVLNVKLNHIQRSTDARRSLAAQYDRALSQLPSACQRAPHHSRHGHNVYAVRLRRRDEASKMLRAAGIEICMHHAIPVHLRKSYADYRDWGRTLPVTEDLAKQLLPLPIHPELPSAEVGAVASELEKIASSELRAQ